MSNPIKIADLVSAIKSADPSIQILTNRGKGSHLMLFREDESGKISYPLPTASGEIVGPYQKQIIKLFGLPKEAFDTNKKRKKAKKKASRIEGAEGKKAT